MEWGFVGGASDGSGGWLGRTGGKGGWMESTKRRDLTHRMKKKKNKENGIGREEHLILSVKKKKSIKKENEIEK
ncbi:hypothetical protein M0802_007546 [Mischocyttarus mexicanus]|nr:hypothetical protein M0802_007546 [Mischocyttarus mexicanus]